MIKKWGCKRMKQMDILRVRMHDGDIKAVPPFRELHVTGVALNFVLFGSAIFTFT
jgi:hypothetical protein